LLAPHCVRVEACHSKILTSYSYLFRQEASMVVTEKGQVTIPKRIRVAAGVAPGSEVSFSLEGGKIVLTAVATNVRQDRRSALRAAAARVRNSMSPEFKQMGAQEIMDFLRSDDAGKPAPKRSAKRRGSK
jgi:antitoxin PrlF